METIQVWKVIETEKRRDGVKRRTLRVVPDQDKAKRIATARRVANRTKEISGRTVTIEESVMRIGTVPPAEHQKGAVYGR